MKKEWFEKWFNSPYYHKIYEKRDREEARKFVDNIIDKLHVPPGAKVCDLACGKGRYAAYLHSLGYDVVGLDLSENSIQQAKQQAEAGLEFYRHDMRDKFCKNKFDVVFNFFTSFGYFHKDKDHIKTLKAVQYSLRNNGLFMIDFLNVHKLKKNIIPRETKHKNQITFVIKRWKEEGFIYKNIHVKDKSREMNFTERIRAFYLSDFKKMFSSAGMVIRKVYGDYKLNPYSEEQSPRLIIIAEKNE